MPRMVIPKRKYTPEPGTNPLRAAILKAMVESQPDIPVGGRIISKESLKAFPIRNIRKKAVSAAQGVVKKKRGSLPEGIVHREAWKEYRAARTDPDVDEGIVRRLLLEAKGYIKRDWDK